MFRVLNMLEKRCVLFTFEFFFDIQFVDLD